VAVVSAMVSGSLVATAPPNQVTSGNDCAACHAIIIVPKILGLGQSHEVRQAVLIFKIRCTLEAVPQVMIGTVRI
jgi:hypothetical protein